MIQYTVHYENSVDVRKAATLKEAFDDIVRSFAMEDIKHVEFRHDFTKIRNYEEFKLFMSGAMFLKNHLANI
jgi:hypothetical protein